MKNKELIKKLEKLSVKRAAPRGFGDTVAAVLRKLGVQPCESCKRRQEALNKRFPYQRSLFK